MLTGLFLITVIVHVCVKCDYFPSHLGNGIVQFQNQAYSSQSQNYGSQVHQDYGPKIRDCEDIRQRLVPVALISSIATSITYPPLEIIVKKNASLQCTNDGSRVSCEPSKGQGEVATLTGGPAKNKLYSFGRLSQTNDAYPNNTRVGSSEDGKGFPLQFPVFFYNKAYGSLKNALNYTDGTIQIIFHAFVQGMTPNPLFEPYCRLLAQVKYPNTTATICAYDALEWLLSTLDTGYYVYPGSFLDFTTGRQIPCATGITPNFYNHPWVSYSQWEAFEKLLNRNYQPLANSLPVYPLAGRSLLQANSPISYTYV